MLNRFLRGITEIKPWCKNAIEVFNAPCKWFAVASSVWIALAIGVSWLVIALLLPALDVDKAGGVLVGMAIIAEALLPLTKLMKSQDYINDREIYDLLGITTPLKPLQALATEAELKHSIFEAKTSFLEKGNEHWDIIATFQRVNGAIGFWIAACAFVGTLTWAYCEDGCRISVAVLVGIAVLSAD